METVNKLPNRLCGLFGLGNVDVGELKLAWQTFESVYFMYMCHMDAALSLQASISIFKDNGQLEELIFFCFRTDETLRLMHFEESFLTFLTC